MQSARLWPIGKKEHLYVVPISINVSVADIETINVPEFLQDLIIKYGLTPEMLLVEITETAFSKIILL